MRTTAAALINTLAPAAAHAPDATPAVRKPLGCSVKPADRLASAAPGPASAASCSASSPAAPLVSPALAATLLTSPLATAIRAAWRATADGGAASQSRFLHALTAAAASPPPLLLAVLSGLLNEEQVHLGIAI